MQANVIGASRTVRMHASKLLQDKCRGTIELKSPEAVSKILLKRFRNQRDRWLAGEGQWPLTIDLSLPGEKQAQQQLSALRDWLQQWRDCRQCERQPEIPVWCERRWRTLGRQRLPQKLVFPGPQAVAQWCGQLDNWRTARERRERIQTLWPQASLPNLYTPLMDLSESEFTGLLNALQWLQRNPVSNLYLRQLPLEGLDSKWLEGHRALVVKLLCAVDGREYGGNFENFLGLRKESPRVRLRLLDPQLTRAVGGLSDLEVPIEQLRELEVPVETVFVVENQASGLAFPTLPGAAVIFRLGYSVDLLEDVDWLERARCFYWGDIDSHGFHILHRIRHYYPQTRALMMDRETLAQYRELCGREPKTSAAEQLSGLSDTEQALYRELQRERLRLEQERIPWPYALERIARSVETSEVE